MSIEIGAFGEDTDFFFHLAGIEPSLPLWHGHSITLADAPAIQEAVESRIQAWLLTTDPSSPEYLLAAAYLADKGNVGDDRDLVERDIVELLDSPEGLLARGKDGVVIPASHFFKNTWKFCKKHSTAILIGGAVVAVVTAVVIITVATGGSGSGAAAAAGGALLGKLAKDNDTKRTLPSKNDPPPQAIALPPTSSFATSHDTLFTPAITSPYIPLTPPLADSLPTPPKPTFTPDLTSPLTHYFNQKLPVEPSPKFFPVSPTPSYVPPFPDVPTIVDPREWENAEMQRMITFVDQQRAQVTGWTPQRSTSEEEIFNALHPVTKPNFASSVINGNFSKGRQFPPPFGESPLLGDKFQSTVHFHSGINNSPTTIMEGSSCLYSTVGEEFAIQPHLIHPANLPLGLSYVALEKLDAHIKRMEGLGIPIEGNATFALAKKLGSFIQDSTVQRSIDYEVETLTKIANKIIEQNNPNLKQLHVGFSNAGHVLNEALKRLSPEHRATIIVITVGTTAIIDDHLACRVYNVIGDKDWPSRACNGGESGIERAREKANVSVTHQIETDGVLGGHYFMQPQYQLEIAKIIDTEVVNQHEIY